MTRSPGGSSRHALSLALFGLAALLGAAAFAYPFVVPALMTPAGTEQTGHSINAPIVLALLLSLCVMGMLADAQARTLDARGIALMGVIVAINSALRLAENIIPGPGEFSPVFALIILAGYVYGARFGFLTGALTLLISALITAGVGPWLPYQMFAAGWVGLTAGWLPGRALNRITGWTLFVLVVFGIVWGFAYGAIMNLSFWYALAGDPASAWTPGLALSTALTRYGIFYAVTSLVPDLFRAIGNAFLLIVFGAPTLKALWRVRRQMAFTLTQE